MRHDFIPQPPVNGEAVKTSVTLRAKAVIALSSALLFLLAAPAVSLNAGLPPSAAQAGDDTGGAGRDGRDDRDMRIRNPANLESLSVGQEVLLTTVWSREHRGTVEEIDAFSVRLRCKLGNNVFVRTYSADEII